MNNLKLLFENATDLMKENETVDCLNELLKSYNGHDWINYIKYDFEIKDNKNYYKNLVEINDIIELYIITWNKNSFSPIHDHPENGCIIKILDGKLCEELYISKSINDNKYVELINKSINDNKYVELINKSIININEIGYRIGNKILHKITNINEGITVSLHIYSKPNYKHNTY